MTEQPEVHARESKKARNSNIEQPQPEPINKQDPTEPVKVTGAKEQKGANTVL